MNDTARVMLVDDEPSVLAGLNRQLGKRFSIYTATSGKEAIELAKDEGPFAVIVSDMRMPEMSGLEVLERMQRISPDTTRMMLTGNADQQTSVDAVNEGNVFRFFTKPCSAEDLTKGIEAGIRQYQLVTAERNLLQQTLAGSVKLLVDVLSLTNPEAFGRAVRLRQWTARIAKFLELPKVWELEMGVMLTPLGAVAVPQEILVKEKAGKKLRKDEEDTLRQSPEVGHRLLENIPRLNQVARIVLYQSKNFDGSGFPDDKLVGTDIPLGSRLVHILNDIADLAPTSNPTTKELSRLRRNAEKYDPELLKGVISYFLKMQGRSSDVVETRLEIMARECKVGDTLLSDVESKAGQFYLARGAVLTDSAIAHIALFQKVHKIKEPILILRQSARP